MKRILLLLLACYLLTTVKTRGANGDTTYIKVFNTVSFTHPGNFDQWGVFPPASKKFQRIMMKYTLKCESNGQCEWDYTNTIYARQNTGTLDSTLKKATSFTANGQVKDSVNYSSDTTWKTSFNIATRKTDSVPSTLVTIIHYTFVSATQPQVPVDTIKVWPVEYYKFYYDTAGKKLDSVFVRGNQTERAVYTNYYQVFDKIIDYEMGRMITPYAKFFPKTFAYEYVYDVTDYATLLRDSVQIRMNYSGYSYGFTGTIEFFMIEGTPAREAYKVENVWNGYFGYGSTSAPIENNLPARTFQKDTATSSVKLRMTITGHGMEKNENCAEFCEKYFVLKLNNDTVIKRTIWKGDCGSNPIINQGGTWIYDRANWCPGMIVPPYEYNLNAVNGSNTVDVDVQSFVANGAAGYQYGSQLIYYKTNAYQTDAGIEAILAPTKEFIYNRHNPICAGAKILVKNYGAQTISSIKINYQAGTAPIQSYTWTGSLLFDAQTEVTMPDIIGADGLTAKSFKVWIDKVNGQADENPFNDMRTSEFVPTQVLPFDFVIETLTNKHFKDNSYTVKTWWGQTVKTRTFNDSDTYYRDTLHLGYGCYTFLFTDSGGDGLSFWANAPQGNGSVRFLKTPLSQPSPVLKTFNSDFGNFLEFNFRVGNVNSVEEQIDLARTIRVFPMPAGNSFTLESDAVYPTQLDVLALDGRVVKTIANTPILGVDLDISDLCAGMYVLQITGSNKEFVTKKLVLVR